MSAAETKPVKASHAVSAALAAHATAQIAAAQARNRGVDEAAPKPDGAHCTSFTVGWAEVAMCIGFKKPPAG
jgi:hypothetical protein